MKFKLISKITALLISSVLITACGDKEPKKTHASTTTTQKFKRETTLKGYVSNDDGLIAAGEVKVLDSKGKLLTTTHVTAKGRYEATVPKDSTLPIVLNFYPEDGAKESVKEMRSIVVYSSMTKYNITQMTTSIAKAAKELGGYTAANIRLAAESSIHVPDSNKTSTGFRGDPTKQYGGWH